MKFIKIVLTIFLITSFSIVAFAKEKEIELYIDNMTCPSCPFMVKKTLQKIDGVKEVETDYFSKTATVIFDDSKTNEDALIEASTNQGFPAEVLEEEKD